MSLRSSCVSIINFGHVFTNLSGVCIVDFEQVNASWDSIILSK